MVGDLVYCKRDDTARETSGVNLECEDLSYDEVDDCSNLDETPGTYVPEWKSTLVKVDSYIIALKETLSSFCVHIYQSSLEYHTNHLFFFIMHVMLTVNSILLVLLTIVNLMHISFIT